jgi:prenyltransferase beta subunit
MSLRLEMLQVARLAPKILAESAELVARFILSQQNPDGGFRDRKGESDLYYTVFALDSLIALQQALPKEKVIDFLRPHRHGENLDFVHLCCLARCWAAVSEKGRDFLELGEAIGLQLEKFRGLDGGFHNIAGSNAGSAYGAFLGLGAHQDLHLNLPHPQKLAESLDALQIGDGSWANERGVRLGATNSTAAAVAVLRNLSIPVHPRTAEWLLAQAHPQGGFRAVPGAPIPDLLSTATALHALAGLEADFSSVKEASLDFIDSLWTNEGSFHGNWTEETIDTEYTFYGLLALGHLSY